MIYANKLQNKEKNLVYLLFGGETYLCDLAAKTIVDIVLQDAQLRNLTIRKLVWWKFRFHRQFLPPNNFR